MSQPPIAGPHFDYHKQPKSVNHIKKNLLLKTTAVCSPIRGAPIYKKHNTDIDMF